MENIIEWYNNTKSSGYIDKKSKEYIQLLEYTKFLDEYYEKIIPKQRIWHLINNNFDIQICQICGNYIKFHQFHGYLKSCSLECKESVIRESSKHSYSYKSENIKSQTNFLDEYYKEITLPQRIWHLKNDCWEIQKCKICGKPTKWNDKYNKACSAECNYEYINSDEYKENYKQNCLKKHGVEHTAQLESSKLKSKITCLKKYGVEFTLQDAKILNDGHLTKIKNGSYSKSKEEDELYNDLVEIFGKNGVVRQYKDKRYKNINGYYFVCDFYIKGLDWFIEYDGYWTHKPQYLNNEERNILINKWKYKSENGSDCHKIALKTFDRDNVKRQIADNNKIKITFIPSKQFKI